MLSGTGDTPMGAAIAGGLEMIRQRKEAYRANGISYYRPWVFLITDGAPTDDWRRRPPSWCAKGRRPKSFSFFAVGVPDADMDVAPPDLAVRTPLKLAGLRFRDLFAWLSSSLSNVSRSRSRPARALAAAGMGAAFDAALAWRIAMASSVGTSHLASAPALPG